MAICLVLLVVECLTLTHIEKVEELLKRCKKINAYKLKGPPLLDILIDYRTSALDAEILARFKLLFVKIGYVFGLMPENSAKNGVRSSVAIGGDCMHQCKSVAFDCVQKCSTSHVLRQNQQRWGCSLCRTIGVSADL